MRIDFTQLEQYEMASKNASHVISNTLPQTWKTAQHKPHENIAKPKQQQTSNLSFTINYPFEINRSLSPASFNKYFAYLEAKKEIPANTLKFIKTNLHSELQKHSPANNSSHNMQQLPARQPSSSCYFQNQHKKPHKVVHLINKINNVRPCKGSSYNPSNSEKSKYEVQSKVYKIIPKQQRYIKQQQLDGVTLRPMLNYTMNSKIAKKVKEKRNHHFKTCQINVFESLYHDASINITKRQMERVIIQQESKNITNKTSRVRVNTTFQDRLSASIQKIASRKKKAQQKIDFDPENGQKFFIPNISQNKKHFKLYHKSHQFSINLPEQTFYQARSIHYSKDSQKLNHSLEGTTTLNNSFEKDLNKTQVCKYKIVRKPLQKENRLADLYAQLLWSEQKLKSQCLNPQEKKVLHTFLRDFQKYELKYSKNVNKQVFIAVFKDFYTGLNLFDRSILDYRLKWMKQKQKEREEDKIFKEKAVTSRKKQNPNINSYHKDRQYFI